MHSFKGGQMIATKCALLRMAISGLDFTAADVSPSITQGSRHIAGAATGSLIAEGLLVVVDRVKSPLPNAKGRKLDLLRLAPGKAPTAKTFLERHGIPCPRPGEQMELLA